VSRECSPRLSSNVLIVLRLMGTGGAGQGASVEFWRLALQAFYLLLQSVVQTPASKQSPDGC
jgi:hypothetical protein